MRYRHLQTRIAGVDDLADIANYVKRGNSVFDNLGTRYGIVVFSLGELSAKTKTFNSDIEASREFDILLGKLRDSPGIEIVYGALYNLDLNNEGPISNFFHKPEGNGEIIVSTENVQRVENKNPGRFEPGSKARPSERTNISAGAIMATGLLATLLIGMGYKIGK